MTTRRLLNLSNFVGSMVPGDFPNFRPPESSGGNFRSKAGRFMGILEESTCRLFFQIYISIAIENLLDISDIQTFQATWSSESLVPDVFLGLLSQKYDPWNFQRFTIARLRSMELPRSTNSCATNASKVTLELSLVISARKDPRNGKAAPRLRHNDCLSKCKNHLLHSGKLYFFFSFHTFQYDTPSVPSLFMPR